MLVAWNDLLPHIGNIVLTQDGKNSMKSTTVLSVLKEITLPCVDTVILVTRMIKIKHLFFKC
jgi:hypothetical protein